MHESLSVDICVIGGGSGGLSVAAGAAQLGLKTVLIEKNKMGGDCLNYGCIPSKALLAAGGAAKAAREADRFGIRGSVFTPHADGVYGHLNDVISAIEPQDSVERFEGLGVQVIKTAGRFSSEQEVEAGGMQIYARRIVVSTGSSPFIPSIPGLDKVSYLTNETIFNLCRLPAHLIIIGGGPSGLELAQAHRHLGCGVTLLEIGSIISQDDMELVDVVRQKVLKDGLRLCEHAEVQRIEPLGEGVRVIFSKDGAIEVIEGTHLLVMTGRKPNIEDLCLDRAGIKHSKNGIEVDARLRTSNKKVFAIGDVVGGFQFTHVAGYHAEIVIKNALFRMRSKVDYRAVPRVVYTAPELAQVGQNETMVRKSGVAYRVLRWSFGENDRAKTEKMADGLIKAIVTPRGQILGCGIVGIHAGEIIQPWILAMNNRLNVGAIAKMILPYPTLGEVSKRAASTFYTSLLFSERVRRIVKFLSKFG